MKQFNYFAEFAVIGEDVDGAAFVECECRSVAEWRRMSVVARHRVELAFNSQQLTTSLQGVFQPSYWNATIWSV